MVQLTWLVVEADTISTLAGSREPNVTCGEFEDFLVMDGILTAGYLGDTGEVVKQNFQAKERRPTKILQFQ